MNLRRLWAATAFAAWISSLGMTADQRVGQVRGQLDATNGVVAVIGLPSDQPDFVNQLAQAGQWMVYFQSDQADQIDRVRREAERAGLLGLRIFVEQGDVGSVHLTHNLADAVVVDPSMVSETSEAEVLRVLRPEAKALLGDRVVTKPLPVGFDDWSHPYHGPDNNPQSQDQYVFGEFETQFIADPKFSPMPEQTVIAGGRMYKAMGHIAHKANQNEMLNTLLCVNAYNGAILWKRPLQEGFMMHRNTMIATSDALYMGDHESCKVIDGRTGQVRMQITIPGDITDGPVWKWMAMQGDVMYALVGNLEVDIETVRSSQPGLGHWPWGMWKGHDYKDPRTAFGYGRTLVALDRQSGKLLWHYRDQEFLDARTLCMKGDRIFCLCPEKFLLCVDGATGKVLWKNSDADLLEAIGPNERAQHYITGYSTTCYMKCSEDYIFMAGPQRKKMVVASAKDGKLQWTNDVGNLQLVLRDNAIYAAGPEKTSGMLLDYKTGATLSSLPARRACTRATGCLDSVFFRATGGTIRVLTEGNQATHIAPMRPPCQDGVLISNGHLYWGPWMCGCQLSLYGNIGLRPANDRFKTGRPLAEIDQESRIVYGDGSNVQSIGAKDSDWKTFRASNDRSDASGVQVPESVRLAWSAKVVSGELPTAPVAAGGMVFVADRTGTVRAIDAEGKLVWRSYTSGPIYYPPAIAHDRVFVGSADGRVYAFEAATGRALWSFRVAPQDRWIPMYGRLVSRWPVAGGVVVDDDRVYAAAGITHYDGTLVVALDATSGKLLAINDTSGNLSEAVQTGVSMQGELSIVDGELRFPGGGVYELARYDLRTLKCLNEPLHQLTAAYRTAFYPWYPSYDRFVSMEHTLPNGNVLCHDAAYDGNAFGNLTLETPRAAGAEARRKKDLAGEFLRRRGEEPPPSHVWTDQENRRFTSFAICGSTLLATGHIEKELARPFLMAMRTADGTTIWKQDLPASASKGGTAVDAAGRIFVTLEDGQLLCFDRTK